MTAAWRKQYHNYLCYILSLKHFFFCATKPQTLQFQVRIGGGGGGEVMMGGGVLLGILFWLGGGGGGGVVLRS